MRMTLKGARKGLTLVELVVVIVLLSLVVGSLMTVIVRQQQFYTGASEIMEARSNVRQVMDILPAELRGISAVGGDIYAMSGQAIEFRAPTGASIVCAVDPTRTVVTIPPTGLTNALTSWLTAPLDGDSLFIYNDSTSEASADDRWNLHRLTAAPATGNCPTATGFTRTAGQAAAGIQLTISPALSPNVVVGSPIRFFRRSRYQLYQSGDGRWYLGYYDCVQSSSRVSPCTTLQPVSGPYMPAADAGPSGLRFTYFDSSDAVTADPARVARINFVARAETRRALNMPGVRGGQPYRDSVTVDVAVRNR